MFHGLDVICSFMSRGNFSSNTPGYSSLFSVLLFCPNLCALRLTRFTSSNVTIDWVKAAEEANSVSKKQKNANSMIEGIGAVTYGAEDGSEEDYGEELFRDSKAFKGKSGGVLEPGYLDIARWDIIEYGWDGIALLGTILLC